MKRSLRKAFSAALAALLLLTFATVPAWAEPVATGQASGRAVPAGAASKAGGFTYTANTGGAAIKAGSGFTYTANTGGATITGYVGSATSLAIPSTIDGRPVVAIGDKAFENRNLLSVSIPGSVKNIGEKAFYNCHDLSSVTLSVGLEKIGYQAFTYCYALKSVTIPGTVKDIGSWAFFRCDSLESVALSSGIEKIGERAFFYDNALKSVAIPGTVKDIGDYAFSDCEKLTNVTLSGGIEKIGRDAFSNCSALKSVAIPGTVKDIGNYAFSSCDNLASVTLSSGTQRIGDRAFFCAYALKSVAIPGSVTDIGEWAFSDSYNLASVTLSSGLQSIGYGAFSNCYALKSIAIPGTVKSIGSPNFVYLNRTFGAFSNCTGLTSVTLPSGLLTIGAQSFMGCTALTGITIPDSVSSIRETAFGGCSVLKSVAMSRNLTEIRGHAFFGCALSSVTLYDKLEKIGFQAFANNAGLKDVTVYAKSLAYGDEVFSGCPGDLVLVGYADSTTEVYALSYGIDFEAIGAPSKATLAMSASAVKPGLNNPVTFTIGNARRATKARLVMSGNRYSEEAAVLSGGATIRQAFHASGTQKISLQLYKNGAWVDGGAGTKVLKVKSASRLATPSMARPSGGTLYITPGNSAAIAWKGVRKAVRYVAAVTNPANAVVWTGEFQGLSATIPGSVFGTAGSYRVKLCALGNDVQQSGTRTCTVSVVGKAVLGVSSSAANPGLNNPVTFTISGAAGATKARLLIDGSELTGAASVSKKTRQATIRKAFHVSGVHTVALELYRNNAWEDGGAGAKTLTVLNADRLATPVLEKPAGGALRVAPKKGASLSWKGVANAKKYLVALYNAGNACVWTAETVKRSVSIPKSALALKGVYRAEIYALGNSVQRSAPGAVCTITVS